MNFENIEFESACLQASLKPVKPIGAPHAYRRPKAWTKNSQESNAQKWLDVRLSGMSPLDFHPEGIAIYTALQIEVSAKFASVSRSIGFNHVKGLLEDDETHLLHNSGIVLVFCDIYDEEQMQQALDLGSCLREVLGAACCPVVLVPHSSTPEVQVKDDDVEMAALSKALSAGFDGAIIEEPEGIQLACEVRSEGMKQARLVDVSNPSDEEAYHAMQVKDSVSDIVWDYLRVRLRVPIPRQDDFDPCDIGSMLGSFTVGRMLGEGATGTVYMLENRARKDAPTGEVVKAIDKRSKTSFIGIQELKNEIEVMQKLTSPMWQHRNIVQLHEVYHSETHVLLRMQDGGSRNLFSYLHMHEAKRFPLGLSKARSIITQSLDVLCHLHLRPGIAHRDIKPENILVRETAEGLIIQLCDFDLARIVPTSAVSTSVCGTFPFMAPEISWRKPYDLFATDIWSMAIVFLEVLCCRNVLLKAVPCKKTLPRNVAMGMIRDFFENPKGVHDLLDARLRPELKDSMDSRTVYLLEGMLDVQVKQRFTADKLQILKQSSEAGVYAS